jgi:DNA helicase-2/ATP-dependent DNA helicase PcrA
MSDIGKLNKIKVASDLSWHKIMTDETIWASVGIENSQPVKRVYRFIQDALKQGLNKALPAFLEYIINKSGLLKATLKQKDSILQVQILNTLVNFCEKSVEKEPNISVIDWMLMLDRMQDNHIAVSLEMPQVSNESVHLLTAHRAKGLEFDYVFMYDCVQSEWEGKSNNTGVFSFPPTLKMAPETDELEASRRLFYVAMTRASQFLQIGFGKENTVGKPRMPTLFISELLEDKLVHFEQRTVQEEFLHQMQENRLKPTVLPPSFRPDKAFIEHTLDSFVLTVSSLNRYLSCPLSFFYRDILGIQTSKNASSAFGTAIHEAIFEWTSGLKFSKDKNKEAKKLHDLFEKKLKKSTSWFSNSAWEGYLMRGKACLTDFVASCDMESLSHSKPELKIHFIDVAGFKYKGVTDRIDYLKGGKVHLIDYKTGKPKRNTFQKPSWKGVSPYGGVYWRQLAFYHLLFEGHNQDGLLVEEAKLIFLEEALSSSSREVVISLDSNDLVAFKNLTQEVNTKIQAHDFYRGCGQATCVWCNYLKNEILPDQLENPDHLFLDDGPYR